MSNNPLDPAEARRKIELALEIKQVKREMSKRGLPVKPPKAPNPLRYIQWNASRGKWHVRIRKGSRYVINRTYITQEAALAARDHTLATGQAPPGKPIGRPRGSKLVREILRQMYENGELD